MRIFRKKRDLDNDTGKRITWTQRRHNKTYMVVDGILKDVTYEDRGKDFDELIDEVDDKLPPNSKSEARRIYYKPGDRLVFSGNTEGALDNVGRQEAFIYKDTKKGKSAKEMYRDFLRDSEKSLKANSHTINSEGAIDNKIKEAVKKEIRKQHKIHNIKRVSKVVAPILAGSTLLGIAVKNKKKEKEN